MVHPDECLHRKEVEALSEQESLDAYKEYVNYPSINEKKQI